MMVMSSAWAAPAKAISEVVNNILNMASSLCAISLQGVDLRQNGQSSSRLQLSLFLCIQKGAHHGDGRLRVFLHDPMTRIRYDPFLNVFRGEAHDRRHRRAEGLLPAYRIDRHLQLAALGEEGLVVDRILIKSGELREARMHGARQSIELGIMFARFFAEAAAVGGEFVPEAVEIDALAPGDEALHIGSAEAEMPQ